MNTTVGEVIDMLQALLSQGASRETPITNEPSIEGVELCHDDPSGPYVLLKFDWESMRDD